MRKARFFIIIFLTLSIAYLSFKVYQIESQKRKLKGDLIELSKVKYGLFSVDEWKKILAGIITRKVEEFNLSGMNREEMKQRISSLLYKVIDDFEARYQKKKSQSLLGILEGSVVSIFGAFNKIRDDVPQFTEQIMDFMNNAQNRKAVRDYIVSKLNEYADDTFSKIDYSVHDQVIAKYHFADRVQAIDGLTSGIRSLEKQSRPFTVTLLILTAMAGLYVTFSKAISQNEYLLLTFTTLILLVTGIVLPMIEIDARISSMSFSLLGEPVKFEDQVLYYKSKSILEVVQLMIMQSRIDLLFVGILVLTFSVLFPVCKLVCTVLYIRLQQLKDNKLIRFMVFKTGKWSMADVMVIAIFMSYIGFSGIITEQLK